VAYKKTAAMRISALTILILVMISCSGQGKSSDKNASGDNKPKTDTVKIYWEPDFSSYKFDTTINQTFYQMTTYCLNDSAVSNETFSEERSKNENLIEYSVAHNFATDFIIKCDNDKVFKLHITKENFKDSLPTDFIKICHMWRNEFSNVENGHLVFRATFAQPDTDYQMSVLYSMTEKGKFKILKVEDVSVDE
jgi:hypothetical protein